MKDLLNLDILTRTFDDMSIGVGIFQILDPNDNTSIHYVYMNKVLLYEMRKERDEVFGYRIIDVAPEAYQHEGGLLVINTYMRVAAEGGSVNLGLVEYSNHMVAGTYECSVHHIKDNYVYVMLRNVTDLEQTKMELEQKNAELKQFAYIVSHDLKAPLRGIKTLVDFIEEDASGEMNEDVLEQLRLIKARSEHMRELIDGILEYSKAGNEKLEDSTFTLNEVMEQYRSAINIPKNFNLTVHGGENQLFGSPIHVEQILTNLISNAIKYHDKESGNIEVTAVKISEKWVKISVVDDGPGIEGEFLDRVFNVFETANKTSRTDSTGIGLAIVKKLVEKYRGDYGVISDGITGTTLWFTWPAN